MAITDLYLANPEVLVSPEVMVHSVCMVVTELHLTSPAVMINSSVPTRPYQPFYNMKAAWNTQNGDNLCSRVMNSRQLKYSV